MQALYRPIHVALLSCIFANALPALAQAAPGEQPPSSTVEAAELPVPEAWLAGTWIGTYVCDQGLTRLQLDIHPQREAGVHAVFHFEAHPSNPGVPAGRFVMAGALLPGTSTLELHGVQWIEQRADYAMVGLRGEVSADHTQFTGEVIDGYRCTGFTLRRSNAETHIGE